MTGTSGLTYSDPKNTGVPIDGIARPGPASPEQCTGDAPAWGQNGSNVTSPVNSVAVTDPTLTSTPATFVTHRLRYFRDPDLTPAAATAINAQALAPLQTIVTS